MSISITRATEDDLPIIKEIGDSVREFAPSTSGKFWSLPALKKWCENGDDLMLVAKDSEKIVGFALFAGHWPTGKATFENLWVHPDRRRKGIAESLIIQAMATLQDRGYTYCAFVVDVENLDAHKFFANLGGFTFGKKMCWIDRVLV